MPGAAHGVLALVFAAQDTPRLWRGIVPTIFLAAVVVLAMGLGRIHCQPGPAGDRSAGDFTGDLAVAVLAVSGIIVVVQVSPDKHSLITLDARCGGDRRMRDGLLVFLQQWYPPGR